MSTLDIDYSKMSRKQAKAFGAARARMRGTGVPVRPNADNLLPGLTLVSYAPEEWFPEGEAEGEWLVEVYFQRRYCGPILYDGNYYQSLDLGDVWHEKPAPVVFHLAARTPDYIGKESGDAF